MADNTKSEDTLILFGLNPRVIKIKGVMKQLTQFFEKKQMLDRTDRFNFIAFEEHGPTYYDDFLYEPEFIIEALEGLEGSLVAPNIAGGIMVAITFIIDVFKQVDGKCFRLIVLMDRTTPPLKNLEVIQVLVNQVKEFPFYIDFVRVATDDPREDLKLMRFAKINNGEVLFAKNEKNLGKILDTLAEKKQLERKGSDGGKPFISPENEPFFENLSDELWVVDPADIGGRRCQICGESTGELVKCPKCDPISHADCLAQWAKMSNIGIPQVFRCMNCYNLLRLPRDFVMDVQAGRYKRPIEIQTQDQDALLRERQRNATPHLKVVADPLGGGGIDDDDGWGGASNDDYVMQKDSDLEIKFCPDCGTLNFPEARGCMKCGKRLI